jgi:hypothetical protein
MNLMPTVFQGSSAVLAGILLYPNPTGDQLLRIQPDNRVLELQRFFESYQCPRPYHMLDYVEAADAYDVDYRLLPALSVRESTCGTHSRWNNHWGWNSLKKGFDSVESGIDYVTRQLEEAPSYNGKSLDQKIEAYNPQPLYVGEVKRLMNEMSPP